MADAAAIEAGPRFQELRRAWICLCLALLLHVVDEALTGFLAVYNPTVLALRERTPWLPLPTFRFDAWLSGLLLAIVLLLVLSGFIGRGARWTRPAAYLFAAIMMVNAAGHVAGTIAGRTIASVQVPRPMPGFYSSPALAAAAFYLLYRLRQPATGRDAAGD